MPSLDSTIDLITFLKTGSYVYCRCYLYRYKLSINLFINIHNEGIEGIHHLFIQPRPFLMYPGLNLWFVLPVMKAIYQDACWSRQLYSPRNPFLMT